MPVGVATAARTSGQDAARATVTLAQVTWTPKRRMTVKSDEQASCHVLSEHFALTLSTTLFSWVPWQLEIGLGKEYLHHRNQQTPQIRAVSLQPWLLIISQNTTEDWGASVGTWGRAHAQQRDWATLPWWDLLPPQTPRTYFIFVLKIYFFILFILRLQLRTKEESPALIGAHCSNTRHWSPPAIVLSPAQLLRGSSRQELGGTPWSGPWAPALCAGGFYCECPRNAGFPRPWASEPTGDQPVYGKWCLSALISSSDPRATTVSPRIKGWLNWGD